MGLDMWMYGIKDISNDEIPDNMPESWYIDNGYSLINKYENDEDEFDRLFYDMYKYSVARTVIYTITDFDKIKKDYGINEKAYLCFMGHNKLGFQYGKSYKEIIIKQDKLDKYDTEITREALVYKADELAYWRKEYDLQDLIYNEYYGQICNCGFHEIDDEMMRKINRYLRVRNMDKQSINNDGYIAKMYHEWY